jgi:hypothetical protein
MRIRAVPEKGPIRTRPRLEWSLAADLGFAGYPGVRQT